MDAATSDSGSGNPPLKRRRIVRKIKGNEGEGTESSDEEKCDAGKRKRPGDSDGELDAAIAASAADRVKELERENKRLREERTCKICLDATAAMLFDPCGHLSTCARCSSSLTECPMCRNRIRKKIKVFM